MGGVPEASNPRLIESSLIKKNGPVGIKPASEPTDKDNSGAVEEVKGNETSIDTSIIPVVEEYNTHKTSHDSSAANVPAPKISKINVSYNIYNHGSHTITYNLNGNSYVADGNQDADGDLLDENGYTISLPNQAANTPIYIKMKKSFSADDVSLEWVNMPTTDASKYKKDGTGTTLAKNQGKDPDADERNIPYSYKIVLKGYAKEIWTTIPLTGHSWGNVYGATTGEPLTVDQNDDISNLDQLIFRTLINVTDLGKDGWNGTNVDASSSSAIMAADYEDGTDSQKTFYMTWAPGKQPSTATVGNNIPGTVRIHFNDGTYLDVLAHINVREIADKAHEVVHVYLPDNDNDSSDSAAHNGESDYTYELDKKITGQKDNSGVIKWNSVTFDAQDIINLLNQAIFTNDKTGERNQKVAVDLNEYTPVIVNAQTANSTQYRNEAESLYNQLNNYLKRDKGTTILPEFDINYPGGTAVFNIHFVKKSNPGDDNNPGGNDNNPGDNTPNNPGNNNNPGNTTPTTPTNPSNNNNNPGNNNNKGNKTPENNTHKKSNPSKKNNRHNQKHYNENSGVKNSNVHARHLSNVNAKAEKAANGQMLSANANKVSESSAQNNKTNANVKSLPATGEEQNHLGLIGLALAGFAALIGLAADRKRN